MTLKAIIFGSINTIIETSDLQLRAFNSAFAEAGLDWHWSNAEFRPMRKYAGGRRQIKAYGDQMAVAVDAVELHKRKTEIFDALLLSETIAPRPGVLEIIDYARSNNIALGFAADTMQGNIDALFKTLDGIISADDFAFVGNRHAVKRSKPHPAIYEMALAKLNIKASQALAIEDCEICLQSAVAANIAAIAFPDKLAIHDNFSAAIAVTQSLAPEAINQALGTAANGEKLRIAAE